MWYDLFTFPYRMQWTGYSCTAAIFQSCCKRLLNKSVGHFAAMRFLGVSRGGLSFTRLKAGLRKAGLRVCKCRSTRKSINAQLRSGRLVVIADRGTYRYEHAMLVVGELGKCYVIADPLRAVRIRGKKCTCARITDCFAVEGP